MSEIWLLSFQNVYMLKKQSLKQLLLYRIAKPYKPQFTLSIYLRLLCLYSSSQVSPLPVWGKDYNTYGLNLSFLEYLFRNTIITFDWLPIMPWVRFNCFLFSMFIWQSWESVLVMCLKLFKLLDTISSVWNFMSLITFDWLPIYLGIWWWCFSISECLYA